MLGVGGPDVFDVLRLTAVAPRGYRHPARSARGHGRRPRVGGADADTSPSPMPLPPTSTRDLHRRTAHWDQRRSRDTAALTRRSTANGWWRACHSVGWQLPARTPR